MAVTAGALAGGGRADRLRLVRIATGYQSPVYVTAAPGEPGRVYVVEQPGVVRVLDRGRKVARPFLDIRRSVAFGGEQGLLSIAFPPDYAKSRRVYVDYTDTGGDTRVVEYRVVGGVAVPSTARELLFVEQPYPNHNGGQLEFDRAGRLYVGMGDGGSGGDPENRAQNLSERLGKLLSTLPSKVAWRIDAYGLRNPWRFSFDRATGELWIGDVGQNAWEEIDRWTVGPAVNFGWPRWEGTHPYKDARLDPLGKLVDPVFEYSHELGCSVTGGYVYRGARLKGIVGRYFFGDYCSGRIWSLPVTGAADARLEAFRVPGLVSFGQDLAGELYLVAQSGAIYRLAA